MAQDVGMMYCGVIPILFGWFLWIPSLHLLVFIKQMFFVTCSCVFLFGVFFFRNGKREKRWEGRPKGRCMVRKVQEYKTLLFTVNSHCKFSCEIVILTNKPLYGSRNCCPCKLHMLSCVESSHVSSYIFFIYSSPSNTYLIILHLEACTYPLSMFCIYTT